MANYITIDELPKLGIRAEFLEDVSVEDIETAIAAASSEADCYLSALYETSLTTVPMAVKLHVAKCAVYHLLSVEGFDPRGSDTIIVENYDRAIRFFKDLQKSKQSLPAYATAPEKGELLVAVSSGTRRW